MLGFPLDGPGCRRYLRGVSIVVRRLWWDGRASKDYGGGSRRRVGRRRERPTRDPAARTSTGSGGPAPPSSGCVGRSGSSNRRGGFARHSARTLGNSPSRRGSSPGTYVDVCGPTAAASVPEAWLPLVRAGRTGKVGVSIPRAPRRNVILTASRASGLLFVRSSFSCDASWNGGPSSLDLKERVRGGRPFVGRYQCGTATGYVPEHLRPDRACRVSTCASIDLSTRDRLTPSSVGRFR